MSGRPAAAFEPLDVALDGPRLVAASAGTGKTYTLTSLVLRLLLEPTPAGDEPPTLDRILVVTFTRAATAELRGRIRQRLAAVLAHLDGGGRLDDPELATWLEKRLAAEGEACRKRTREALRDIDDAAIFTIHGFCQRMLQEYAFESGVDFDTDLVGDEAGLLRTAIHDYWALTTYEAPPLAVNWLAEGGKLSLDNLQKLGQGLVRRPTVPRLPPPPGDAALDAAGLAVLDDWYRDAWSAAAAAWKVGGPAALEVLVEAAESGQLNKGSYRPATIQDVWLPQLAAFFTVPQPVGDKDLRKRIGLLSAGRMKTNSKGREPQHPFFEACASFDDTLKAVEERLVPWGLALRHGLDAWLARELPERKRRARQQSYDDLLHRLHQALAEDSPGSRHLAARIRGRYRAALIDEFQDTDLVQFRIFRQIFAPAVRSAGDEPDRAPTALDAAPPLLLIGDPKQAIYAFRGADVFAYLQAAEHFGPRRQHTLTVNYRTDRSLVEAVNALWRRLEARRPFLFDEIPFVAVKARYDDRLEAQDPHLPLDPPLTLAYIPAGLARREPSDKVVPVELGRRVAARAAARAIGRLLARPPRLPRADGRLEPAHAGDVAVLTRTNREARRMQRVLRAHGIASVLTSEDSVLDQPEAEELRLLLAAVLEPANVRRLRTALAGTALGLDAAALEALDRDEGAWEAWVERFRTWRDDWQRSGFLPALGRALDDLGIPARLLALADGERRLTNFLHLAELLHGIGYQQDLGPAGLLAWFDRVRQDADLKASTLGEAAQLRLESDARAVRISTIHKAKGLEYPFVFCPFLWDRGLDKTDLPLAYHDLDGDRQLRLDIGPEPEAAAKVAARLERLAEQLRLLYVAMTRARHRLWLTLGPFNQYTDSALAYLLHAADGSRPVGPPDGTESEPSSTAALDAWQQAVTGIARNDLEAAAVDDTAEADPLWRRLAELAAANPALIAAQRLAADDVPARAEGPATAAAAGRILTARQVKHVPRQQLHRSSFSSLTSAATATPALVSEEQDHDALAALAEDLALAAPPGRLAEAAGTSPGAIDAADRIPLADLEAGARLGSGLHALLERIDFAGTPDDWQREATRLAERRVLPETAVAPLLAGLEAILRTPLGTGDLAFSFADVARENRINEMRYVLPVALKSVAGRFLRAGAGTGGRGTRVGPAELAAVLAAHPGGALPPDYPARLRGLSAYPFAGWLSGALDLVFRRRRADGGVTWYLADWKSNRLGTTWDDYRPDRLREAMAHHHYYLQAHLYALALHRYLARQTGQDWQDGEDGSAGAYDYERDFGGILYLFVRGMRPDRPGSGVFFDRPPPARLAALDRLLAGVGG